MKHIFNMRATLALAIVLAWGASHFAAVASAAGKPERISVAYCLDCVQFHFQDKDGKADGLIIDMWRLWSERTGIAVDFKAATWEETLRMVGDGRADAHAGLFFNEERAKFLEYGTSLTETDTQFFVHKELPGIESVEDLTAYKVGVLSGDYVEGFLKKKLPPENIVGFESYEAIMEVLREGRLQVFAADTPTGIFHLQKAGLGYVFEAPASEPLYTQKWFVAATKGNTELIKVINAGMALVSESERHDIRSEWMTVSYKTGIDIMLVLQIGGAGAVIVIFIVLWNRRLSREVKQRKHAEEVLAEKEAQLWIALDNMPGGMMLEDRDRNYVLFNSQYSELHDYPEGFLKVGMSAREEVRFQAERGDFGPGNKDELVEQVLNLDQGGKATSWERTFPNGRTLLFNTAPTPEGGLAQIVTDITESKRAEQELNEKEGQLRVALDNMPGGMMLGDRDLNHVLFNSQYIELLEFPDGVVRVGGSLRDEFRYQAERGDFGPGDKDDLIEQVVATYRRGEAVSFERDIAGSERTLQIYLAPTPEGGYVIVLTDITERKRAEEALREKTEFLELNQIITRAANEAASVEEALQIAVDRVCAHTGWPVGHVYLLDDAAGDLVSARIWHQDDPEQFATFRRVSEETRFASGVGLPGRVLASGEPAWIVDVTKDRNFPRAKQAKNIGVKAGAAFPVLAGRDVLAVLEFFSDKPAEPYDPLLDVMAQIGTQLGRVVERTRAQAQLVDAKDEAMEATQTKSRFLASMSHELRTPLNAIIGFTRLVMRRSKERLEPKQYGNLEKVLSSAERLLLLINDILDLSKIVAGQTTIYPTEFAIDAVIDDCLRTAEPLIKSDRVRWVQEVESDLPKIFTDEDKVRQILLNLLSNAAKFTEEGRVTVRARSHDEMLVIEVADTGIGIPAEAQELIFEEFGQTEDGATRQHSGTGLGLAITRHLAQLLGGDITVKSTPGAGSTFTVTILQRYAAGNV